jgi:hypothetical protein
MGQRLLHSAGQLLVVLLHILSRYAACICTHCCHCLLLLLLVEQVLLLVMMQVLLLSSRHMMHVMRLASTRCVEARLPIQLLAAALKRAHHSSDHLREEQLCYVGIQGVQKSKIH